MLKRLTIRRFYPITRLFIFRLNVLEFGNFFIKMWDSI